MNIGRRIDRWMVKRLKFGPAMAVMAWLCTGLAGLGVLLFDERDQVFAFLIYLIFALFVLFFVASAWLSVMTNDWDSREVPKDD